MYNMNKNLAYFVAETPLPKPEKNGIMRKKEERVCGISHSLQRNTVCPV